MRRAYEVAAVRESERLAVAELGEGVLMQRAAAGLAALTRQVLVANRGGTSGARIVLLVGKGSNGGDALLAGAALARRGAGVLAIPVFDSYHVPALAEFIAAGGRLLSIADEAALSQASGIVRTADVVIDGILGIGGRGGLGEPAATLVRAAASSRAFAIAVDLPSGIDADTGAVADPNAAFRADLTVTFACLKPGLATAPGRDYCGRVEIIDIGVGTYLPPVPHARVLQPSDLADFIRPPGSADHKYSRGVVGLVAGSRDYPGAGLLAVGGARYSGVGMVRFWDREDGVAETVVRSYPDVVLQRDDPADDPRVSAWVVGPGLGRGRTAQRSLHRVLMADVPVVIDADALNALRDSEELKDHVRSRTERGALTVLTPHTGEFAAFGSITDQGRIAATRAAAARTGCLVVLKGSGTVIAGPHGAAYVDPVAAHELATAGSGDVLSGLIGGFLANRASRQGSSESARCVAAAVYVHGLAGQLAGVGLRPVVADDIIAAVPEAIATLRQQH